MPRFLKSLELWNIGDLAVFVIIRMYAVVVVLDRRIIIKAIIWLLNHGARIAQQRLVDSAKTHP